MISAQFPIQVRLVQISQRTAGCYYLPYSVGLLQAYAQAHLTRPEQFHFLPPLFERLSGEQALKELAGVQVVGFSTYIWNIQRSLALAQVLKQSQPETLIVFGGPQVPDAAEGFLRQHPFIDICVHGPGEAVFLELLETLPQGSWDELAGVSYLDAAGAFQARPPAARPRDLSAYPSPYLSGVFEPLFAQNRHWYAVLETNRGCPFSCTFCDWGSATQSKVLRFEQERVFQEMAWMSAHQVFSIFCADANFGMLKRDLEIALEMARLKRHSDFPKAFQIQTAKNVTTRIVEVQKILTAAGLSASAAISLQSLHPETLKHIKRENISLEAYREIQAACLAEGIFTYTDIIMALPGETYASFVQGVNTVMMHGQYKKILFHDTALLPNAEMAQPAYRQQYGLETVCVVIPGHCADETPELMEIVVANQSLNREDWRRVHVFAWMCSFLFYTHKLLQQVLIILQTQLACDYITLIERFCFGDLSQYPLLSHIQRRFAQSAWQQQQGYPLSQQDSLIMNPVEGTSLTPDVSMQLYLSSEGLINTFYAEAADLLGRFAIQQQPDFPLLLLKETFLANRRLFLQHCVELKFPIKGYDPRAEAAPIHFSYNLKAFFEGLMRGQQVPLQAASK